MHIVFYSNCQCSGIKFFLNKTIKCTFSHIENFSLIRHKKQIPIETLKKADVLIYQPIHKKHGIYSTDSSVKNNILTHLSNNCKKISFPYIYNSSLWILIPPAIIDGFVGDYPDIHKYINREPIIKLKKEGLTLNEVLTKYRNGEIDFDYENRFKKSIEILREKEEICDVKVSQFIKDNISKKRLFFTQNHPTTCVFIHCANQILSILNEITRYDPNDYKYENIASLPGRWLHTSYDKKYWNFEFNVTCNDESYEKHIIAIYKL